MIATSSRLRQQIDFIVEADKLKSILRRAYIGNGSRRENDAEHSWHFCLMAIVLQEYANDPNVDLLRVLKMAILHDIVEIDAGDTYIYDKAARQTQAAREQAAAERLFGLLPEDQSAAFRVIWDEFEDGTTAEARFAKAIDRLHPMLQNHLAGGKAWREHGIVESQVHAVNRKIEDGSETLWQFAETLISECVETGLLEAG